MNPTVRPKTRPIISVSIFVSRFLTSYVFLLFYVLLDFRSAYVLIARVHEQHAHMDLFMSALFASTRFGILENFIVYFVRFYCFTAPLALLFMFTVAIEFLMIMDKIKSYDFFLCSIMCSHRVQKKTIH